MKCSSFLTISRVRCVVSAGRLFRSERTSSCLMTSNVQQSTVAPTAWHRLAVRAHRLCTGWHREVGRNHWLAYVDRSRSSALTPLSQGGRSNPPACIRNPVALSESDGRHTTLSATWVPEVCVILLQPHKRSDS